MENFILASSSPRRLDLLRQVGLVPSAVIAAEIDETPLKNEEPTIYCKRVALEKAKAISKQYPGRIVLSGDTIVCLGRRILGKPSSEGEAVKFLQLLSGRRHKVLTAVCIAQDEKIRLKVVQTAVRFKRLTDEDIKFHASSGQWRDKSGGYMIQGIAASFILSIIGSASNVIGLPLCETSNLLKYFGVKPDISQL